MEIILSDKALRRDNKRLQTGMQRAGFEQYCALEDFDRGADVSLDRRLVDAVFSLEFLQRSEHVIFVGPVGVGKSFLAQALGHAAIRAGYSVRFARADRYFREMAQARLDGTLLKAFRSYASPDLLILNDLGLQRFNDQQSLGPCELVIARHRTASFAITSNRAVEEWLQLFSDPLQANSALDRLANSAYQVVIEGESYRRRLSPYLRLAAELAAPALKNPD